MKIKLLKAVPGIGRVGEIVDVSDAQARNFLLPNKLAVLATGAVVKAHQAVLEHAQAQHVKHQEALAGLIQRLEQSSLRLKAKASPQGKLFAAVKMTDVQVALEKQFSIKLSGLLMKPDHLKTLGTHQVQIILDQQHQATITILVEHGS